MVGRSDFEPGTQLGGEVWGLVTPILEAHGNQVLAPDLGDEHTNNLTDHIRHVRSVIESENAEHVVLVGHSYGGMVITGLAAQLAEKIGHLVYVDAALPNPGESLFDVISTSGRDPLSFSGLEPAAAYVEKLEFDPGLLSRLHKTYVACTKSDFSLVTSVMRGRIASDPSGWACSELPTSHFAMVSMPQQLAEILRSTGDSGESAGAANS